MKKIFFGIIISFLTSCGGNNDISSEVDVFDEIVSDKKEGTIRGANLGASVRAIRANEPHGLTENDSTYLFYEFTIDTTTYYTVAYNFVSDSLNEIRIDVYLRDDEGAAALTTKLKKYFSSKFNVQPQNMVGTN